MKRAEHVDMAGGTGVRGLLANVLGKKLAVASGVGGRKCTWRWSAAKNSPGLCGLFK